MDRTLPPCGDDITVYVGAPTTCDICPAPIGAMFYDGATVMGPWANMCPSCFAQLGRGLETGLGQQYTRSADSRFRKSAG